MGYVWQGHAQPYQPPWDQPPWIRQMIAASSRVCVQLTPEELAALQRVADRVQAGDYQLDRCTELTLRLIAYKGAFERGWYSDK